MARAFFRPFVALAAACVLAPVSLGAQQRNASIAGVTAAIRASDIWGPLRFLSDDLLEGRGTGARGGELTTQYLASRFMALGLEPMGDSGTFFQRVLKYLK